MTTTCWVRVITCQSARSGTTTSCSCLKKTLTTARPMIWKPTKSSMITKHTVKITTVSCSLKNCRMITLKICLSSKRKKRSADALRFFLVSAIKKHPLLSAIICWRRRCPSTYLTECGATNEIIFAVSSRDVNLEGLNLPL